MNTKPDWGQVKDLALEFLNENTNDDEQTLFMASDGTYKINSFMFEGVMVTITDRRSKKGGAVTLPGIGIFIGINGVTKNPTEFWHEFGHILISRELGLFTFYFKIAPVSLFSAGLHNLGFINHFETWTEWTASKVAYDFFNQPADWNPYYIISPPVQSRLGSMPATGKRVKEWISNL